MDPVRAAKGKLLVALRGKRGFNGVGLGMDIAGNPELAVLWLRGVAIPPFPSSVDGVPIVIRITPPFVARNEPVSYGPHGERARSVENVPRPILVEIVRELQAVMYVQKPDYEAPFWNKDKPFGARELDFLDEIMRKHGLAPE